MDCYRPGENKSFEDYGLQDGFITSEGRFVSRKEGARIFMATGGQPKDPNRLDSRDLIAASKLERVNQAAKALMERLLRS